jgi:hypothetical protein
MEDSANTSILPDHNILQEQEEKKEKYVVVGGKNSFNPRQLGSNNVVSGLDFILSHFREPVWPRTISTKTTEGRQVLVYNKEEALARFKQCNLLDCRINAYPFHTEYQGINRQAPDFIFIDLDRSIFKTERAHKLALFRTLKNIKEKLGAIPTVLWSGNGYHIYQPIEAFVLEQEEIFSQFDQPSRKFLKFAAQYLSDYRSDPNNNPSFKSCLIRIPGSYNYKCVQRSNDGIADSNTEIKTMQKWDGVRRGISGTLLYQFYINIAAKEIKCNLVVQPTIKKYANNNGFKTSTTIPWIEKLLQTSIDDYRKNAISLILAPYLINIKRVPYDSALNVIKVWLDKCSLSRTLDCNFNYRLKYALDNAIRNGYLPISLEKLKEKNKLLYNLLSST